MVLCALMLTAATVLAVFTGSVSPSVSSTGMFFSLGHTLTHPGPVPAAINLVCLLATGLIMLALNKVFNFVRSVTHLFVSTFLLLQVANPASLTSFNAGTLVALVAAITMWPLFGSYQDRHAQRSIFLIFALIAAGSMFHYGFLVLLPAYVLGFMNMRALNFKGVLAMLFGLVTPFWIILGLGIVSPADFKPPMIHGIWQLVGGPHAGLTIVLAAIVAVMGIVLAVMNLLTIMNFRMQTRVYNAFMVFALVTTVIAMSIDYRDISFFLPLLGLMVAVQVANTHTLRTTVHYRYIFMLLLIAGALGFCAAQLIMP